MLSLKDMQFQDTKEAKRTTVRGRLSFTSIVQIENDKINGARFDVIEEVKHRMRREIWEKVYGDLMTPFHELAITMIKYADETERFRVHDLVKKIEELLTLPKE